VHALAVPAHDDLPAGEPPVVDVARQVLVDARQPGRVEAHVARFDLDVNVAAHTGRIGRWH
jgi:hypothetical protein